MRKLFRDYFIPHSENDHKPHILREVTLVSMLVVALVLSVTSFGSSYLITSTSLLGNVYSSVLVDLTNANRIKEKKPILTINPTLVDAATMKVNDMVSKNYFAHTSPEGLTPWYWFKKAGYSFSYAGENLAVGFSESEEVNNGWLNSPTHKANIIDEHFTEIGIATKKGIRKGKETTYVVQMFGKPKIKPNTTPVTKVTKSTDTKNSVALSNQSASVLSAQASETDDESIVYVQEIFKDDTLVVAQNESNSLIDIPIQNELVAPKTAPKYSTTFERILANQPLIVSYVLIVLMVIVSFGLLVFLIHEVRIRHYKHFILGLLVFLVLFGLWILNHSFILFDKFI